jgi:hypothetical protein
MSFLGVRRILSIDVGYRNLAKVLAKVSKSHQNTHIEILDASVTDVLNKKKPKSIAHTAKCVVENILPLLQNCDEVVVEQQVRKSGMNFGLAYSIHGACVAKGIPITFMAAKQKFLGNTCQHDVEELHLKKRSIKQVQKHIKNPVKNLELNFFIKPFIEAKKKDDLADALLQLLSHVGFKCEIECDGVGKNGSGRCYSQIEGDDRKVRKRMAGDGNDGIEETGGESNGTISLLIDRANDREM